MTDLEEVTQRLDALKNCPAPDIHTHFSPALRRFRFIPRPGRRACADAFFQWANDHAADAPLKLGCAVFLQGMDRFIAEELQASLPLLTRARAVFVERDDREGLGLCAMLIGATYRTFGNYDLALKMLWEGFELLKTSGRYPIFLAATANSMANIDLDMGNLDEALAMFNVTYAESTRADDFYFAVYGLHGLGRVYMQQARAEDAKEMFERALRLAEKHEHPLHISNSLTELATFHFRSGNLDAAETLSTRALAIREQHRLLNGAVTNCLRLAEIRCVRSQWAEARQLLTRALAIAEELKVKPKMAQVHLQLSELYERMRDPKTSLLHYKQFHELREEVEREDNAKSLADAKAIFEAEQTRKENVIIKEQKAEIQRQNHQLQDTIDELTRAKIGRRAKALTLAVAIVLFIFQDAILRTALRLLASDNYFLLLGVKMAIIFSLSPINRGIERHLLRKVMRKRKAKQEALLASLACLTAFAVLGRSLGAQAAPPREDPVPAHDTFTVGSRALGETRLVNVYVPPRYRTSAGSRFPVLYMPDGGADEDFPHVVNTVDSLIALRVIRPVIVVGIPNTERRRDLTGPTRVASDSAIAPHVGGSAAFRRFVRDELMPVVGARYRTTDERSIVGESLAGLFVVETFLLEPALFSHYVALDPAVWWNRGALVDSALARLTAVAGAPRTLYLGSSNVPEITEGTARLADVLRTVAPRSLAWVYVPRPDLTHATIFRGVGPGALASALR
jgi:predicted alpha/beta superfamily hydrolase/tetratricopeptide (TPR) repeat protein